MGRTAQVSEARWTCGQDGHCIITDRSLAASFHGLCDGQAIAIVLPGGQSKRSFMGGGSPSVTCNVTVT
jgi:hypothetical protein